MSSKILSHKHCTYGFWLSIRLDVLSVAVDDDEDDDDDDNDDDYGNGDNWYHWHHYHCYHYHRAFPCLILIKSYYTFCLFFKFLCIYTQ